MTDVKKEKLKRLSTSTGLFSIEEHFNSGFARGKCRIAYAGKNNNYSDIPREAFEKAQNSLYGVPIVGNWLGDNFGGHDFIVEQKGNKLEYKENTIAYGFVPESANITWEEVEDENGNIKMYQVCDVILWHKKYPEEIDFLTNNGANQSMEISIKDGEWGDDWKYFCIEDFEYNALCILGKDDENKDKNIEPCFEDAEFLDFNFSKQVEQMKDEFKKSSVLEFNKKEKQSDDLEDVEDVEDVEVAQKSQEKIDSLEEQVFSLTQELEKLREFKQEVEAEREKIAKENVINQFKIAFSQEEIDSLINEDMSSDEVEAVLLRSFTDKQLKAMREDIGSKENFSLNGKREVPTLSKNINKYNI